MKSLTSFRPALARVSAIATVALLAVTGSAQAQSFCASDGLARPVQLLERFINANCENCWADPATPEAGKGQLALDWVLPGDKGDDAALSAVATRDAADRLEALHQGIPAQSTSFTQAVKAPKGLTTRSLRVAHGLPLNGYLGASIELKPVPAAARGQRWTAWLALVETLPVGAEGSPVERNLVRNVLQTNWDGRKQLSKSEQNRFFDSRAMSIAQGANPERLRVVGWVEDDKGQLLAAAESRCAP